MADPNIDIRLTTTADTSGAEAVESSLFGVEDASKKVERQAEADIARGRTSTQVQQQQAESLREIADNSQRIVAINLAKVIGEVGRQFGDLGPEATMAIGAIENGLTTLATTGNPIAAVFAVASSAIGGVVTAWREASAVEKASNKQLVDNLKKYAEMRANFVQQIRNENLQQIYQAESDALEEQERILGRIFKIRASERELLAAQQTQSGAAAVAGGAAPEGEAAKQLALSTQKKIDELTATLEMASGAAQIEWEKANALWEQASNMVQNSDARNKVEEAFTSQQEKARIAEGDLAALATITDNQIAALRTTATTEMAKISEGSTSAMLGFADEMKAQIDQVIANAGGQASSQLAAGLSRINEVLADRIIDPSEIGKLHEALVRISTSAEATNGMLKTSFDSLAAAVWSQQQTITPLLGQFQRLQNEAAATKRAMDSLLLQSQQTNR